MDVIITYKKNRRVKRLENIEFVEFDVLQKRFYYWPSNCGDNPKIVNLMLVADIKVNSATSD